MNKKSSINKRAWLSTPYGLWIIGFTVIPLIMIIRYALTNKQGEFTLANLAALFQPIQLRAMIYSILIALACTVICVVLSYPLALAIRHLHFGGKGVSLFILILPMWMNFILRIMAMQLILSNNGILNYILGLLGMRPLHIANTMWAVLIGVVYDYLPFMALPIYNAVAEIDEDIIEAARDLGAGSFTIFRKIILPLSKPGLLSGIVMVFVPSMTSFVVPDILGGGKLQLIGNIIEQEFTKAADWNLGSGLSVALMIFVMISMIFSSKNEIEGKESAIW